VARAHRVQSEDPLGRKCPRILNDWTTAQPNIDKSNRWRQRILAIEERFTTQSFPFRLTTTVIAGMAIASAYTMFQYFVNDEMYPTFRDFVEAVAFDGMQNTWDQDHSADPGVAPTPVQPPPPLSRPSSRASCDVSSAAVHYPISISQIEGWRGFRKARCSHCQDLTAYCCAGCSDANAIVPVHRVSFQYKQRSITYPCLAQHTRDPEASRRSYSSASKSASKGKRKR